MMKGRPVWRDVIRAAHRRPPSLPSGAGRFPEPDDEGVVVRAVDAGAYRFERPGNVAIHVFKWPPMSASCDSGTSAIPIPLAVTQTRIASFRRQQ